MKWYLEVIRTIHPPEPTGPPMPIQYPTSQPAPRQHSLADIDRATPRSAIPTLHLPTTPASLSDSNTDADQARLLTSHSGTTQYDVQFRTDGFSTVGQDAHQLQVRFMTDQECKHITLPESSTWVPWAKMSVIEYKHHQNHESGMQNIWRPYPYCWLVCAQLAPACKQQLSKDDFWFRLWHYFDQFKDAANRSSNRLSAAHELSLTFTIHHTVFDDNLRKMMHDKIGKGDHYPDVSNWSAQLGVLEHILSNWKEWPETVQWILPHIESGTPILMVFYNWQTPIRSYTNNRDAILPVQTVPWGHATTIEMVGALVYELCRSIFGDMQLDRTVQDIITDIQKIFENIPDHIELDLQQQDLSGFFNSVPHTRMIEAVTYAVHHYIAHKGVAPDSKLSTSLALEDRTQRIFRGRFRRAGQKYLAIQLDHIFPKSPNSYSNTLTLPLEAWCSDRFKVHPWAVILPPHFAD